MRERDRNRLKNNKWYHATDYNSYENIQQKGIIVDYNRKNELDFGYGFYLSPSAKDAENYIKRLHVQEKGRFVVMEFEFQPLEWFEDSGIPTAIFNDFNDEFAEFVFNNRNDGVKIAMAGKRPHEYDVVYGVMSDSVPTTLLIEYAAGTKTKEEVLEGLKKRTSVKQISLHSQELCDKITLTRVYEYDIETDERKELNFK